MHFIQLVSTSRFFHAWNVLALSTRNLSVQPAISGPEAVGEKILRPNVAEMLILKGGDVNALDEYSITPLHMAASYGHKEVVELLILKGADVNVASRFGITPLTLAKIAKQKDITELLIKQGGHE